jgi:hypothetical protein
MANTANTQEPTMEEILASIRRIISEDGEEKPAPEVPKPKAAAPAAAARPAPKLAPQPEPEEAEEDVLELTDIVPEEDEAPARRAPAEDDVVMVERSPMKSAPKTELRSQRPRYNEDDRGLISDQVRDQASSSFMQLARNTLVSDLPDSRSLEALVQDMLRPLLEDWLNQNLPTIVERLVQQEIDRVSRKGR